LRYFGTKYAKFICNRKSRERTLHINNIFIRINCRKVEKYTK